MTVCVCHNSYNCILKRKYFLYINFTSIHFTEKRKPHPQRETVMRVCLWNKIGILSVVVAFFRGCI